MNTDQKMVLLATTYHTGLDKPYETWVPEWEAEMVLSTTHEPVAGSLDALALSFFRLTKNGFQSIWYIKAGPVTYAELEEWYATGLLNGEPYPGSIRPSPIPEVV